MPLAAELIQHGCIRQSQGLAVRMGQLSRQDERLVDAL
jgi:hypothetical protein